MQVNGEEFFPDDYSIKNLNDETYLVMTFHGSWTILDEKELLLLQKSDFETNPIFFSRLKENNIVLVADNIQSIVKTLHKDNEFLLEYPKVHEISLEGINDEKIVSILQFIASVPERNFTIRF